MRLFNIFRKKRYFDSFDEDNTSCFSGDFTIPEQDEKTFVKTGEFETVIIKDLGKMFEFSIYDYTGKIYFKSMISKKTILSYEIIKKIEKKFLQDPDYYYDFIVTTEDERFFIICDIGDRKDDIYNFITERINNNIVSN